MAVGWIIYSTNKHGFMMECVATVKCNFVAITTFNHRKYSCAKFNCLLWLLELVYMFFCPVELLIIEDVISEAITSKLPTSRKSGCYEQNGCDFKFSTPKNCLIFFWVIPWHLNFMCWRFGTLSPIFTGTVSSKNNRDKTARVFIQVKVWLKNSLSQLEVGEKGMGHVRVEEQGVEGKDPKWRPLVSAWGRKSPMLERGRGATGW